MLWYCSLALGYAALQKSDFVSPSRSVGIWLLIIPWATRSPEKLGSGPRFLYLALAQQLHQQLNNINQSIPFMI